MAAPPQLQYFHIHRPAEYIAHVEINRPSKLNAFNDDMWYELRAAFDYLSPDPTVRAIILSGAGPRAFTAGLDVAQAQSSSILNATKTDPARQARYNTRHVSSLQQCLTAVEACEKPVLAVLHGICYGLAVDLSSCVDVRFCTADAQICVKEVDIGLAADVGTLTRLPKIVGNYSWVKDVCLTARPFGAEEALAQGFVSRVLPDKTRAMEEAMGWARLIAEKSPVAVQGTKELLNFSREHNTVDGLRYTQIWNAAALQAGDVQTALRAGMARKRATFEKL